MRFAKRGWIGLGIIIGGYLVAAGWVWTHSAPLIPDRPVTIRIAHWQVEAGPPDGMDAVIKRYEQLNPRVRVLQQLIPGIVYKQWMRTNLASGSGADIIEWGAWLEGVRDVPARYFEPVTEALGQPNPYNKGTVLEKTPWQKTFKDNLQGSRNDSPDPGQIFGVTMTECSVRLFCNRQLLREATGSEHVPQTFDEMRKIFLQLDAYSQRTGHRVMGIAGAKDNAEWLLQYLLMDTTLGLNFSIDDSGMLSMYNRQVLAAYLDGRWNWSRPEVRAGLELLRDVGRHMKPGFLQLQRDEATREFLAGDALFIFTGTWDATSLKRLASFEVGALRFPQPAKDDPIAGPYLIGRFQDGGGVTAMAMHLTKNSAHKAEALDFMRFMTSLEGQQLFTDGSGWLPATLEVKIPPAIQSFVSPLDGYTMCQPYSIIGSTVTMEFERNLHLLLGQNGSVDRYVAELDRVMPAAVRADLQTEVSSTLITLRAQDARMIAQARLSGPTQEGIYHAGQRALMESGQTLAEATTMQMMRQLKTAGPAE
ncbi:MAG: extracellular solute-binding protein [Verrucomicrobia bacterium]|nr:extracellular solute-binding protein [Verrucomicrobiota bacterium]